MKTPIIHPRRLYRAQRHRGGQRADRRWQQRVFRLGAPWRPRFITIGDDTNIQDNCVLHEEFGHPVSVGSRVTVGHGAILHSCTIGDETLIGMGAIILNGAVIGSHCIVGTRARWSRRTPSSPTVRWSTAHPPGVRGPAEWSAIEDIRQNAGAYRQGKPPPCFPNTAINKRQMLPVRKGRRWTSVGGRCPRSEASTAWGASPHTAQRVIPSQ